MQSMLSVNVNVFTAVPSAHQLQASPLAKTTNAHKRIECRLQRLSATRASQRREDL